MIPYFNRTACVLLATLLAAQSIPARAADPALARLSFWVPPERLVEFEAAYQEKVAPYLEKRGLVPSSRAGRPTVDSVFSRLFEFETRAALSAAMEADPESELSALLQELGTTFGTPRTDGLIRFSFTPYQVPAGPGQTVRGSPGQGHWRTYDEADAPTTLLGSMLQDQRGYLWFATQVSGVYRYDGQHWTNFTTEDGLASDWVTAILQDREGNIWAATSEHGVCRYDGQNWTSFTTEDGLASNQVQSIFQDREGYLWFATGRRGEEGAGVSRYKTLTTQDGLAGNTVHEIFQDREGQLFFATNNGVSRYDGQHFKTLTTQDGLAGNTVIEILQDREGYLWFATGRRFGAAGAGVSRYDGQRFKTLTTQDGLAGDTVHDILQDREGQLFFATNNGVSRYDGQHFRTITTLAGNQIFQDREGHLWFLTQAGLSRYDEHSWTTFTTRDGLAGSTVTSIIQDQTGHLWFSTAGNGVSRYDGQDWTTFKTEDGLADNRVWSVLQDREGHLWFGTLDGGLSRYDGERFKTFTVEDGLAGNQVIASLADREGNLWFGTESFGRGGSGVSRYDGHSWKTFTTQDGLVHNRVRRILQDREGYLWFATAGGVSRYDGENWKSFTTEEGLGDNWVESVYQDREGRIWAATFGGASRYDGENWITLTTREGLASNSVTSVLQDRDGRFWFGTINGGVSRYDGQVVHTIKTRDGLAGHMVWNIFEDEAGQIWFATDGGVNRYCPPDEPVPPPVFVDAVIADQRYAGSDAIELQSGLRLVSFEFHGISFKTRPGALIFRYRLRGYDEDWRITRDRRVEYEDLPQGTYTFEVEAVDRDLVYSEEPATVALTVNPPYERIGLLSALGVALLLIAWQSARVVRRGRRLREANTALSAANKELFGLNLDLQQKTTDLEEANQQIQQASQHKSAFLARMSHDLRTPMNAIIGYTRILRRRLKDSVDARQARNLENIQTSADHLLSLINDILDLSKIEAGRMDVQPEEVDLVQLAGECVAAVESLLKPGVQLQQHLEEVDPLRTDPDRLRRVLMNLLSNAVKFTEEGSITVSLKSVDGQVELGVADTGVGIPAEDLPHIFEEFRQVARKGGMTEEGTGLGLAIAKKSVELLGGTIAAESEVGKGTRFSIRITDCVG